MPDILFIFNRAATPFSDCPPSYSSTWTSRAYSPLHGGSGSSSAYSGPETRTRTASGKNKIYKFLLSMYELTAEIVLELNDD